jgi:hypothetical protein
MGNRKAYEQLVLQTIDKLTEHKENVQFYKDKFASLKTDAEFEQFVNDIRDGKFGLSLIEPNFSKKPPKSTKEVIEVAESLGAKIMQKLYIEGKKGMPTYQTEVEYPVFPFAIRRASQLLTKKISVPPHTRVRDLLTGQVTGESKGATVSGPENQLLGGMGAMNSAIEMDKFRGGDLRGEAALVAMLSKYGRASQSVLEQFASGVQVTAAVKTFLTAAMHRTNL